MTLPAPAAYHSDEDRELREQRFSRFVEAWLSVLRDKQGNGIHTPGEQPHDAFLFPPPVVQIVDRLGLEYQTADLAPSNALEERVLPQAFYIAPNQSILVAREGTIQGLTFAAAHELAHW